MSSKIVVVIGFVFMVLTQWFVPSKMILDREDVLKNGEEFRFKCKPIDPSDPFRGKYITLSFIEDNYRMPDSISFDQGENIFISLDNDIDGFAKISAVSRDMPSSSENVIKAEAKWTIDIKGDADVAQYIRYPFDRYYMEESKAKPAEDIYNKSTNEKRESIYALVMIKDGEAVLKNVIVDGIPIKEYVEKEQNKNSQ